MSHWTGTRSGWNARGVTPLSQQIQERRQELFDDAKWQAVYILGREHYLKLVDHMPDDASYDEALLWLQELVKVGELLQGVCRHLRLMTDEDGYLKYSGGDLIEVENISVYCADCGRSLVHMSLA